MFRLLVYAICLSFSKEKVATPIRHLTVHSSRPPAAAAELRALVPSPALCAQPLISALGPVQKAYLSFWHPALASQAPPAIILAVLRRFRGPAVFLGLRPSSRLGAPFWPSGLTLRSSRPAYGGRLIWAVRPHGHNAGHIDTQNSSCGR